MTCCGRDNLLLFCPHRQRGLAVPAAALHYSAEPNASCLASKTASATRASGKFQLPLGPWDHFGWRVLKCLCCKLGSGGFLGVRAQVCKPLASSGLLATFATACAVGVLGCALLGLTPGRVQGPVHSSPCCCLCVWWELQLFCLGQSEVAVSPVCCPSFSSTFLLRYTDRCVPDQSCSPRRPRPCSCVLTHKYKAQHLSAVQALTGLLCGVLAYFWAVAGCGLILVAHSLCVRLAC